MSDCKFSKIGKCDGGMTPEGYCEHHRRHFLRANWAFVDELRNEIERLRAGLDESRDMFHEAQNKIVDMKKEIKRLQRQVDSFAGTIRQQREELAKIGGGDE